jgi:hypothetical protein
MPVIWPPRGAGGPYCNGQAADQGELNPRWSCALTRQ